MITIGGRKMGKSYNNVIKLTELFSGNHPLLEKAYSPMTIRFFVLQTHHSSTLDFGNEALQAAEKGFKRLMDAYKISSQWSVVNSTTANDAELEAKVVKLLGEFDDFMNDDFNTAKVLANMFELVPIINGIKDNHIAIDALSSDTLQLLQKQLNVYIKDIFGLKDEYAIDNGKLNGVMQLLIDLRKAAKAKKDYATSDSIRKQLQLLGIELKDEKDGGMSYSIA